MNTIFEFVNKTFYWGFDLFGGVGVALCVCFLSLFFACLGFFFAFLYFT